MADIPPPPLPAEAAQIHPPSPRRLKRRLMLGLLGLYILSVIAACVLVLRPAAEKGVGRAGHEGLLSLSKEESVGWLSIHGPISNSELGTPWERGVELWSKRLRGLADTAGVKAIVLDINSPGGSVGAVQELHSQILRVRREKNIPVVALFADVSASGGYYLGAACDKIVAHPGTITGSIGVIFSVMNLEGLFAKIGFKQDPIKSGAHKDIGSPARPMTKEERALLQDLINDAYDQFVRAVSTGRHMSEEEVRPLADGRIYSGNQALKLKLVDKLGDSSDAIELAATLGGIKGKPKVRRDTDSFRDMFDMLGSRFSAAMGGGAGNLGRLFSSELSGGLEYRWRP